MKAFRKHTTMVILGFLPFINHAQEITPANIIESIIESHVDIIGTGTNTALIIEDLEFLAENPININACGAEELSRLYLLNAVQINKLLEYIDQHGPAYTIYELKSIDGFTQDILEKMQIFVYFGESEAPSPKLKEELKYAKHQLLFRGMGNVQKSRGYKPNEEEIIPFEGNRFRYYSRYNFKSRDKFAFGFTAEKDPGEAFFSGSNKQGFDYYSAFLSIKPNRTLENITIGDFIVRSGQGLVIWQGYTSGKSENTMSVTKTGQGIRGYTSVDENLYFRGLAGTLNIGKTRLSLFYSRKKSDGNIAGDSTLLYFTSLQTSGYHRTSGEIEDEKSVQNINFGGIATRNFKNLKIGLSAVYQKFEIPYMRSAQLYNRFRFGGNENYTIGADYLFGKGKYQLFGEFAMSKSTGKAFVQGTTIYLNDQLSFSALIRHFDRNFHALWANTFAEGSNISNESGLYSGIKFLPAKYVIISAYADMYRSRWINYTTAGPTNNWDIFVQADFQFSDKFSFYTRFKNEEKEQKFKLEDLYINSPERIRKTRIHFQYNASETLVLRTRAEHAGYRAQTSETGYLLFQDFKYTPKRLPFSLSARVAYFDTESYNSRIYAYENDVLYNFSIPAYFGQGIRTYLNAKFEISEKTTAWLRLANTHWTDREVISSGYNEISGSDKTELKLQFRLKF